MSSLHLNYHFLLFLLFLLPLNAAAGEGHGADDDDGCRGRSFRNVGGDSVVCVCDAKACLPLLPADPTPRTPTTATTFTTSRGGLRFKEGMVEVVQGGSSSTSSSRDAAAVVEIAVHSPKQVMKGFGGAFTDAAAITMSSLSPSALDALLRAYFSPEGLEYSLIRVPIAGSDFSLTPYTYADTPPTGDSWNFALAEEDEKYKLPLLRRALALGRRPPLVLASPWSAPAWMKDNKKINESGQLLRENWQHWSNYIVKFIEEYKAAGVPIWAISSQNHPFFEAVVLWNSMAWTPDNMRDWIKTSLGPTLSKAGLEEVKVFVGDENRDKLYISRQMLNDPEAARYISGVAVHWYLDKQVGPVVLDQAHLMHPSKDILYTEGCIEPSGPGHVPVLLGSWERAERYAADIIENANHYVSGWIDWNLSLDMAGGPNWRGNRVDAPVIVNEENDEFYLQPIFFAMGHFSKFVPPGSVALHSWVLKGQSGHLLSAAFAHPEGHVVLQLLNLDDAEMEVRVEWDGGTSLHSVLPPRSLQTLLLPWDGQVTHEKRKYYSPGGHCEEKGCH